MIPWATSPPASVIALLLPGTGVGKNTGSMLVGSTFVSQLPKFDQLPLPAPRSQTVPRADGANAMTAADATAAAAAQTVRRNRKRGCRLASRDFTFPPARTRARGKRMSSGGTSDHDRSEILSRIYGPRHWQMTGLFRLCEASAVSADSTYARVRASAVRPRVNARARNEPKVALHGAN